MKRLVVVSNRLPVTVRTEHGAMRVVPSTGGLATALEGLRPGTDRAWIGWPGDVARLGAADVALLDAKLASAGLAPVHLSTSEVAHFYDGFSNGVLWPLLHYALDKVRLDADHDWSVYRAVNARFADRVAAAFRPGDLVWVHDYQLALVPQMLRERIPEATIGFFLHVPFPAPEVFGILPGGARSSKACSAPTWSASTRRATVETFARRRRASSAPTSADAR